MYSGALPTLSGADYTVIVGDAMEALSGLPSESVHCAITSPPYWKLRDYGIDGQLGLEESVEEYITALRDVFSEVRRVLRRDGTLWLNMGDSYANTSKGNTRGISGKKAEDRAREVLGFGRIKWKLPSGYKEKEVMGIPWRVAFALQEDGWLLRQDIILERINPVPENIPDRCTRCHDYLFLLTRGQRYFFSREAIMEPANSSEFPTGKLRRSVWHVKAQAALPWHPAPFPAGLVELCVLAGTSPSVCSVCGHPYTPRVSVRSPRDGGEAYARTIEDWEPGCPCSGPPGRAIVLDMFAGSGETGVVSLSLGRSFVGIELNPRFAGLASERLSNASQSLLLSGC